MRKYLTIFSVAMLFACTFSRANGAPGFVTPQTTAHLVNDTLQGDTVFQHVEVEATFPGGVEAWSRFLESNLKADVPAKRKAPAGVYTVVVQFVVDVNGNVSQLEALTRHGFGMEQEVLRVLKRSPRWLPAVQDGRKVKAYRKQPISFAIANKS